MFRLTFNLSSTNALNLAKILSFGKVLTPRLLTKQVGFFLKRGQRRSIISNSLLALSFDIFQNM